MPGDSEDGASRRDHYIVCGLNGLGLRLAEHLHELGAEVVVVTGETTRSHVAALRALGITVVEGAHDEEVSLQQAGITTARALAFVADDDIGNLRGALTAGRLNEELRVVLRLYNEDLGDRIKTLFDDCIILSQSAITAPFFAAAALGEADGDRIALAGRALLIRRTTLVDDVHRDEPVLLPLANIRDGVAELFPEQAEPGGEVLVDLGQFEDDELPSRSPVLAHQHRNIRDRLLHSTATLRLLIDRRLRLALTVMAATLAAATVFFSIAKGLSPLDALYFSVVTLSTVGYGDINLQNDPPHVKIVGIIFILFGAALIAILFALMTDTLIGVRLASVLGTVRGKVREHVVVCGLGNVGMRVVRHLVERGITVVAVERDEDGRHVAALRRMGVPVVIGDATLTETLHAAQIETATALVVTTDNDVADLETAVNARALHPKLRIILRLFDNELSTAIERRFAIHISRSSAAIAAPIFATQMLRQEVVATCTVGGAALAFAELDIADKSSLVAQTIADVERGNDLRVLAIIDKRGTPPDWHPSGSSPIAGGQRLAIVGRPTAVDALRAASA